MGIKSLGWGRFCGLVFMSVVALLFLAFPGTALAHARMVRSSPTAGNTVQSPQVVELWFNELLDAKFNSVQVFPASELNLKTRTNLVNGEPKVDAKDRTHLTIELKSLEPGQYYVEWRVLSLDGHSAPGRFKFEVTRPK